MTSNEELMKEDRLVNRAQPREMDSMGGTAFTASLSLYTANMSPAPKAAFGSPSSIAGNGNTVVSTPAWL